MFLELLVMCCLCYSYALATEYEEWNSFLMVTPYYKKRSSKKRKVNSDNLTFAVKPIEE